MSAEPSETSSASDLTQAILAEERQREASHRDRDGTTVLPDDLVGLVGEPMRLSDGLRAGGIPLFSTLFLLSVVDEFDRAALAVLGPDIQAALGMSDTQLGIVGGAFGAMFVLGAVPIGALADRVRRTGVVAVATTVWAATVFVTGFVRQLVWLFVARLGTGLGQSNALPVHSALLADGYPISVRGRIYALHGMASPIGQVLAPATVGAIAATAGGPEGWRWAFWVIPVPALILGLVVWFLPDPPRGANELDALAASKRADQPEPAAASLSSAFGRLSRIRTFRFMLLGIGALGFALFSVPLFINLYLEDRYGLSAFERGTVGSVIVLPALVTIPLAGRCMDRLFQRSPPATLLLVAVLVGSFGIVSVAALYMPNLASLVVVLGLGTACSRAGFVAISPIVAAVVPYRLRSQGFAMIGVYIFLFGAFSGSVITGMLSDAFGERAAVTIVAIPASVIGGLIIARGSTHIRRDISLVIEELVEERDESRRLADTGDRPPVLQARNLDFSYGTVQVLFDVELEVFEGEVLALLGTNGAGKSTLLRCISGLGVPDRGVVRLDGRTITYTEAEERVRLGIVQVAGGRAVWGPLSVRENLILASFTNRGDSADVQRRLDTTLDLFPALRSRLRDPAESLSGGQQQMLALAKALMLEPRILLIDELSLGLAPVVVQDLLATVETLRDSGLTIVIVEQSINVALTVADRAVFMERGEIRFDGPADQLLDQGELLHAVFLGAADS